MTTTSSTSSTTTTTSSTSASSYASSDVTSIDWDGLIEELYEAKLAAADTYETKISTNESKISAYNDAADLLETLQDAADALRAVTDSSASDTDVFLEREAYLTGVGGVTASSVLTVSAEAGTDTGSYSITISQLATAQKVASGNYASSSSALSLSGTFSIGTEDGDSVSIDVTEDMSLSDIASAINEESDTSGVKATVLKVSDSSYELILTTVDTGQTISVGDDDGILQSLGIVDDSGGFADELQASQQAIFTIDGVTITRSSNEVDDVIDGLTFYLTGTTDDDQSVTVEIDQNLTDIKSAVVAFVDAYNAYREWALSEQETSSSGGASADAVLFGDSTIRTINQQIASALTFSLDDVSMSAIGLSFDESNYLEYDEDTLNDVLNSDPDIIQQLFSYSFESSSSDLGILYRGTSAPSTFTLDITVDDDGNITGVTVDGESGLFTVTSTGHGIKGVAGTAYEGYTFVFTGSTSQSVTVTQAAGIAEQIYNATEAAIDDDDGSITNVVASLEEKNDEYQDQIDTITDRAETYKDNLTARYANIQAKISEAQSVLSYLEALLDAQNSDS
ncbi:Flagellar hook-associated protein FliD [uncultured Pleomorphomonas sp.]|uniref:Flagellar hook-associated protein 2 n=1 Tax=uncultured Pleomorphomonas sp. TaxID=442121 RepID=A0A212L9R7_9HYPH|nr:flagellar filament capping protein FliD [uncultured Pleomorphomonas sp.]SCM74324.1 Flagellar hook-associated protein FliD [uncultured Pleomorphomonas sp.]